MAVGNKTHATYLKVSDGKIVRSFKTPTSNSIQRTTKTGKLVHEEFYDYVEGTITSITTKENEYGKFWVVRIKDGDETYILEFNYSGGVAASFLKTLPNVNLGAPVVLTPKQTIDGDKKRTTLFVNQGGKALKWFWNKENPGDLPELKKIKVKGKESWDDSEQMEYLENYVKEMFSELPQEAAAEEDDF